MSYDTKTLIRKLTAPLYFDWLWLCPPLALVMLYGGGAAYGLTVFRNAIALKVVVILALGCVTYLIAYHFWLRRLQFRTLFRWQGGLKLASDHWIAVVAISYLALMIYTLGTAPKIALLEALRGGDVYAIAGAREMLFKSREGWERVLVYLNAILTSALIPYALVVAYLERKRYRHWLLWLFVLSLLPSMEKALVIKAFFPLVIVAINRQLPRRMGWFFLASMVAIILTMTAAAKVGHIGTLGTLEMEEQRRGSGLQNRFEQIDSSTPVGYVLNRTLWIPYLTAYDWIFYFQEKMDGQYLLGRTSTFVSTVTGQPRFNMEHEVSVFEYGETKTGTANTMFLIDAYVNLSWLGVILSALLVAVLTRIIMLLENPAAKACYYYFIYQLAVGPLLGVMLSEGMLLFMAMAILTKPPSDVAAKESGG
jgi:hypothetical protein